MGLTYTLTTLGSLYRDAGRLRTAQRLTEEALTLSRQIGARRPEPHRLSNLARIALLNGDFDRGRTWVISPNAPLLNKMSALSQQAEMSER